MRRLKHVRRSSYVTWACSKGANLALLPGLLSVLLGKRTAAEGECFQRRGFSLTVVRAPNHN